MATDAETLEQALMQISEAIGVPTSLTLAPCDLLVQPTELETVRLAFAMASSYRAALRAAVGQLHDQRLVVERQKSRIAALCVEIRSLKGRS